MITQLPKPIEYATQKGNCCKHGLYVIMYQDWLINQNNMPH